MRRDRITRGAKVWVPPAVVKSLPWDLQKVCDRYGNILTVIGRALDHVQLAESRAVVPSRDLVALPGIEETVTVDGRQVTIQGYLHTFQRAMDTDGNSWPIEKVMIKDEISVTVKLNGELVSPKTLGRSAWDRLYEEG